MQKKPPISWTDETVLRSRGYSSQADEYAEAAHAVLQSGPYGTLGFLLGHWGHSFDELVSFLSRPLSWLISRGFPGELARRVDLALPNVTLITQQDRSSSYSEKQALAKSKVTVAMNGKTFTLITGNEFVQTGLFELYKSGTYVGLDGRFADVKTFYDENDTFTKGTGSRPRATIAIALIVTRLVKTIIEHDRSLRSSTAIVRYATSNGAISPDSNVWG